MILQNIVMPNRVCNQKEIYYQSKAEIELCNDYIKIPPKNIISFFSYMNMFDMDAWKKYSALTKVIFQVHMKGIGNLFLKVKAEERDEVLRVFDIHQILSYDWDVITYEIDLEKVSGCCYFEVAAESEVLIRNACFTTVENEEVVNAVKIALNICTYHRNEEIQRNLMLLKSSRFFCVQDELFQKLQIMIVDNGSELEKIDEPYVRLVHNPNTGGSGGFKRGLEEIRTWKEDTTHVVFMDDDVEFLLESLYRVYALLSFMRTEYQYQSVAGRMFRTDTRHVQYTAAEIWNKGDLRHIGFNADMTLEKEILQSNENSNAEYGGWWFCSYPMEFARENDPLPFFIHCDDVEYGLRHGGTPIILNGIQVWHETYEYRQSPVITYYDTRNSLIVNDLCGFSTDMRTVLAEWKKKISEQHVKKEFLTERMIILGMWDYLKGMKWLIQIDSNKYNQILKRQKGNRIINSFFWRFTNRKFVQKYINE